MGSGKAGALRSGDLMALKSLARILISCPFPFWYSLFNARVTKICLGRKGSVHVPFNTWQHDQKGNIWVQNFIHFPSSSRSDIFHISLHFFPRLTRVKVGLATKEPEHSAQIERERDMVGGTTFAKTICSICYEDLKPIVEDIQAISICGHVFHELWSLSLSLSLSTHTYTHARAHTFEHVYQYMCVQ
jgi:hypothetical protein